TPTLGPRDQSSKDREKQKAPTEPTKAAPPARHDQAASREGERSAPAARALLGSSSSPLIPLLPVRGGGGTATADKNNGAPGALHHGMHARPQHAPGYWCWIILGNGLRWDTGERSKETPKLCSILCIQSSSYRNLSGQNDHHGKHGQIVWFMPVNVFFTFIFGLIFGWIVIKVTGAPLKLRGLILGCCSAGNLGNIFLIIIPALCKEKGSPFGAPDVCQTYGLAYSSLSLAIGAVFLWTGAYNIIRANSNVTEGDGSSPITQTKVLVSGGTRCADSEDNHSISSDRVDECALPLISNPTKTKVSIIAGIFFFSAQVLIPHHSLLPSPANHHTPTKHSNNYPPILTKRNFTKET
uniref:Uncharacterized protein n=1 Tax=Aegilops tauschii subsp. strangulata TaxID=200361 RepID=A0A453L4I5_AEGTS